MIVEYTKPVPYPLVHSGLQYLEFLGLLNANFSPSSYLEIGTSGGDSLAALSCDAICIDPLFRIMGAPPLNRRRTLFFQMTSDDYFKSYRTSDFFPRGPDICFLDGLHRFEFLFRDFINAEAVSHPNTMILMHDCLPVNQRMAERTMRTDESEDPSTRSAWAGDVWRIIPALKQRRPDLRIMLLDCGPTGLVVCTRLDPNSKVLPMNYDKVVDEAMNLSLSSLGLDRLWGMFPMIDTRLLAHRQEDLTAIFNIA